MKIKSRERGFTLIELSIVLVIIGLVVGSIFVGQEMIRGATDRAEISMVTRFESAFSTFRTKYNCVPGDCSNATTFFPTSYNGNGNGMLDLYPTATYSEGVYAWQQLALAKLIPGSYDGNSGSWSGGACSSTTCPTSKLNPSDAMLIGGVYDYYNGSAPVYGLPASYSDSYTALIWENAANWNLSSMAVYDMFYIDKKMDDGIADRGRFVVGNDNGASTNCVTGLFTATNGSVNYNMADTTHDCSPIYIFH